MRARTAATGGDVKLPMDTTNQTNACAPICDCLGHAEDFARREPARAMASAAGLGLLLNFLPIRALLGMAVGVALVLVRPALLLLGLYKAAELCQSSKAKNTQTL